MPWKEVTHVSQRKEFVTLASTEMINFSQLCRRFEISRKTGYKWFERSLKNQEENLSDRSRRPIHSPGKTLPDIEKAVLAIRATHSAWGGRKIHRRLLAQGCRAPSASTITAILRRHGKIDPTEAMGQKAWQRFEAERPNDLWQMDFKGDIEIANGRCYPLTVLDDHSRYSLGLEACAHTNGDVVKEKMIGIFRRYGMPKGMLMDNGAPWGTVEGTGHTHLTVWLMRMGVSVWHSRPYHPQTLGKDERFHRTLKAEVLQYCTGYDLIKCQERFDEWRIGYNTERPHEALCMEVPASRYYASGRGYEEKLPEIEYSPGDVVRKVIVNGLVSYHGKRYRVGKAFVGEYVGLRPTVLDGVMDVFFCNQKIAQADVR